MNIYTLLLLSKLSVAVCEFDLRPLTAFFVALFVALKGSGNKRHRQSNAGGWNVASGFPNHMLRICF